jgi:CDP-glycerol glycerophosphotransferase (TagB/SpsB family)
MEQYDRGAGYVSYDEQPYILTRSNEELYKAILKFDEKEYLKNLKLYSDYVGSYEKGIACERIFEYIQGRLKDEK